MEDSRQSSLPQNQLHPISKEVNKQCAGLLSLKEFELVIILRFLPARDKLSSIGLLNKRFHSLVRKHYSWSRLPSPGPRSLVSDWIEFLGTFPHFMNIHLPQYPP